MRTNPRDFCLNDIDLLALGFKPGSTGSSLRKDALEGKSYTYMQVWLSACGNVYCYIVAMCNPPDDCEWQTVSRGYLQDRNIMQDIVGKYFGEDK